MNLTRVALFLIALICLLVAGCELPPPPAHTFPPSISGSRFAVANRGANTITLIDADNEQTLEIELEAGSEPMYAVDLESDEVWIGDRGHDRILVYDKLRLRRIDEIPTGKGVFHMWKHPDLGQLWVVNDIDKTMTVISMSTREVLATVPIPKEFMTDYKPHDITLTANSAIVALSGRAGIVDGWLIKYSGETFEETARLQIPGDPHLMYWGWQDSNLYIASQLGGKVLRVDPHRLEVTGELDIPGAHGIWANEQETRLFVTNIESNDGTASIYTIDLQTFQIIPGSPVDAALPHPHNVAVSISNHKLLVTHSYEGSENVSIYDLDANGLPTSSRVMKTGAVPFGIMLIRDPIAADWVGIRFLCPPYIKAICLFRFPVIAPYPQ